MSAPESVTITMSDDLAGAAPSWPQVVDCLRHVAITTGTLSPKVIADQIEAQLPKPKPEEPKGLGAVVKDRSGVRWVHIDPDTDDDVDGAWESEFAPVNLRWSRIDVVEVLSEGVTA